MKQEHRMRMPMLGCSLGFGDITKYYSFCLTMRMKSRRVFSNKKNELKNKQRSIILAKKMLSFDDTSCSLVVNLCFKFQVNNFSNMRDMSKVKLCHANTNTNINANTDDARVMTILIP